MDSVFLEGLTAQASVGLLDWEKENLQPVSIDCHCYLMSCQQAALNADLSTSVDYAAVRELILSLITSTHYELLETLGETIVSSLFAQSQMIQRVVLSIKKTTIFQDVIAAGVCLDRSREGH